MTQTTPSGATVREINNFDLLRLFAAFLVFWMHGFFFKGSPTPEWFGWLSPGALGVFIFFLISGYLVSESWEADPHPLRFLARRALRIFPGLVVLVLLTALVLGPAMTTLPLHDYFHHPFFALYFHNAWLEISFPLPGVFGNEGVNGSLWSLRVEFALYLCLILLCVTRVPRWLLVVLLVAGCWGTVYWVLERDPFLIIGGLVMQNMVEYGTYFLIGVCVSRFRLQKWLTVSSMFGAVALMYAVQQWPVASRVVSWFAFPCVFLTFGLASSLAARALARFGDFSYGVYIYALPVQQTVLYLFPALPLWAYVAATLVVTLALAAASWHLIERRALRLKPRRPLPAMAPSPEQT
jgi:peptidoglycan/LPS O-acetylase OafA/YrhL